VDIFARRPWLAGLLVGIPIAAVAGAFAQVMLGPIVKLGFELGPARTVAFAAASVLASVVLAGRMSREDLGTFSGLVRFWVLAHGMSLALTAAGDAVGGAFARDDAPSVFVYSAFVSIGATLPLWIPLGVAWVAAIRRLTIPGLTGSTEIERAASEAARDAAARHHVEVDAVNIADQGSRLRRNRT
jgi:hypothetical protein